MDERFDYRDVKRGFNADLLQQFVERAAQSVERINELRAARGGETV